MAFIAGFSAAEAENAVDLCMQLNGTGLNGPGGAVLPAPDISVRWLLRFDSRRIAPGARESRALTNGAEQPIDGMGPFDNAWSAWQSAS